MSNLLHAVIVAAGASRRMGFDKLTADLCGKPVLVRSLEAFARCPGVGFIVLVAPAGRVEEFRTHARACENLAAIVPGGAERPDSVAAGLSSLAAMPGVSGGDFVALHDAARPLIATETIMEVFRVAQECGGAAPAELVSDTLHRTTPDGNVMETVPRANLWRVQTPQIFSLDSLLALPRDPSRTDEISAFASTGGKARMVANPHPNFKITVPADLALARALLG